MHTIGESLEKKQRKTTADTESFPYKDRPVVILHGWGSSGSSFFAIKDFLNKKGFPVYIFDLPGFGNEDAPLKPWSVDDYVKFVFEFAEKKKLPKFYLFGHSLGGRISIKFAAEYPEKLSGLILYAAAGIKHKPSLKNKIFLILAKFGKFVFSLPVIGSFRGIAEKGLYFLAGTRDYYRAKGVMKETMKMVINEDLKPFLPLIKASTLIVWGRDDKTTPITDAMIMKREIKGSKLAVVDDSGHSLHKERPEEFTKIILPFLLE
jgi:pimeloyl-ACP methyl ester carboxylesterase